MKLNCGKELQTYQFVAYSQKDLAKNNYDQICDCAKELNLQNQNKQINTSVVEYKENQSIKDKKDYSYKFNMKNSTTEKSL